MIRCNHCTRTTRSSETVARLQGWRFFSGLSQTGKQLDTVLCPVHSGQGTEDTYVATWIVRCSICNWDTEEDKDQYDPLILTAYEAKMAAGYHTCEPLFEFIRPDGRVFHEKDPDFLSEVNETTPHKGLGNGATGAG